MDRRVLKGHDERKAELLDAAQALFLHHGYESTPVSAIIEAIGVSKGTFYHYFDSKQDLLDGLAGRIIDPVQEDVHAAADLPATPAIDKLNAVLAVSPPGGAEGEDNLRLRVRINRQLLQRLAPPLTAILLQGVDEGAFDTRFPAGAAELILALVISHRESTERSRRVECVENAIERILGAQRGSVRVP